jgi:predicted DNA-binding protein YlxM (UPF0122 family)
MDTNTQADPKTPNLGQRRKLVDTAAALTARVRDKMTYQEIADQQGVTRQSIHKAITDLLPTDTTTAYITNRADILANLQAKLIQSVSDDKLKKLPAGSAILALCQLYDKERLERGQATSISDVDIRAIIASIPQNVDKK